VEDLQADMSGYWLHRDRLSHLFIQPSVLLGQLQAHVLQFCLFSW
jgi:hypothetical protein